jgi:crotonobetainyl-CoA:carnitine CoA-transferase CaiB-like acyl-CoA transferase
MTPPGGGAVLDGPWAHRKAYDLLVQCEAGLLSVTGTPEHMVKTGISVADIAAGMYAYSGILTARLDAAGIANASIRDLPEFLGHPVLAGRDRWREVAVPGGTISALRPPADLDGVEPVMGPVPRVGEHTDAILRELGRDTDAIARLRAEAVI